MSGLMRIGIDETLKAIAVEKEDVQDPMLVP
jgi:hypothetical protein